MNIKAISINVGKALLVNALFMFIAMAVSIAEGFDEAFTPLTISFLITLIMGGFPFIFAKGAQDISLKSGYLTIVLSWLFSYVVGMLPYVMYGGEFTLINAWFESVSGYTTTGSTILTEIESLPKSLLFWRSSTHFIGGLGVVVFIILILPDASPFKHQLSNLEISSMSRTGYKYKSGKTVMIMALVYLALAISETLLLWAAGMSFFDAVNHAMSTVATGGFSTKNTSILYFDSPLIDLIIMVFMTLAAMHFGVIFLSVSKRSFAPLKNALNRYYFSVIGILTIGVFIILMVNKVNQGPVWKTLLDSAFQVVSFISTTGFAQSDNAAWPVLANLLLLLAAFHCGCSGSTTGGVKSDRMLISLTAIGNEFRRRLHPSSYVRTRIDGHVVKDEVVSAVFLYIVMYVLILLVSAVAVMAAGVEPSEAFSATIASLGNVGPAIGSLGTMGNYAAQPVFAKIVYTFDMFLGRVEIFPILVVISMIFNYFCARFQKKVV